MVRLKELTDKLSPNQKFRNWQASHTFSGTTKTKSLYIAGFRRKNFYYVAAITGAAMLIGGIAGGVSFRKTVNMAENRGQAEGAMGQLVATRRTESRTRTLTSNGILVLTTEISSFETTVQRGGGPTLIRTTGEDGETITIPGAITFVTNSDDMMIERTLLGSTFFVTQADGMTVPTTLYGAPTTFTYTNGDDITSTIFSELTVVTEFDGDISTSLRGQPSSSPTTITSDQTTLSTNGVGSTGSTTVQTITVNKISPPASSSTSSQSSSSIRSTVPLSLSSLSSSSLRPTSLTSSVSRGGGGDLFQGEGTFYTPGLGSCGTDNTEAQFVAALSRVLFDATGVANSNNNPYCGRKALVRAAGEGRLFKKAVMTQVVNARGTSYGGNITFPGWEQNRSMKKMRRIQISSELELLQGVQMNFPQSRPSKEYSPTPTATPMAESYHWNRAIPPKSVITPPPRVDMKRQAGGGGVTITIVDRCPVCAQYDLDLSPAAFDVLGSRDDGRIAIEWNWLD